MIRTICLLVTMVLASRSVAQTFYEVTSSTINFQSTAPKELIHARSREMKGLLDPGKKSFAFSVRLVSFQGFNSPLQREHFNENYMESNQFPEASFSGKIIEDADLSKNGEFDVRAKGKLKIHGLSLERIITAHVIVKNGVIDISSEFNVMLSDHDIKIPRVVYDKLAPEILVSVKASLSPKR